MNRFLKIIALFIILTLSLGNNVHATINMTVSPIKYEIEVDPGQLITQTATLFNYTNDTLNISTSTAEFQSDGNSGKPVITFPGAGTNSIASWITLHTQDFIIGANGKETISFDILVPDNATPGGHYGVVFFENDSAGTSNGSKIGINVDYGVLLLVNVSGEIVKEGEVNDVVVKNNGGGGGSSSYRNKKDKCPLGDFTKSNFDNKCIDPVTGSDENKPDSQEIDLTDILGENFEGQEENQLDVQFEIPFENKGNTHIKPTGKITLVDEDGKQITNVGKEVLLNDNGAIIGEKIVDYIPINDIGGNVLPQTKRIFEGEWIGFPYKDGEIDKDGEQIIKYWSPDEYYTKQNTPDSYVLNFWERVLERTNTKLVTAEIQVAYTDTNGEEIEFNSAEEFYIDYVDTYIGLNKYIVLLLALGGGFIFFFILVKRKKKKKCIHCKKIIEKDILICPYCGKKQKEKKSDKKTIKKNKNSEKEDKKKKKKS